MGRLSCTHRWGGAVGACTVNVHKKHLLIVNQAVVEVPSAFSTRRSSLNLWRVFLLDFLFLFCFFKCFFVLFHYLRSNFTAHPPRQYVEQQEQLHHHPRASSIPNLSWKQLALRHGPLWSKCWRGAPDFWPRKCSTSQPGGARLLPLFSLLSCDASFTVNFLTT